jgi:hypothetical protein
MATEFSLNFGGLGPWRGDMTPLGDEGATLAQQGVCMGGSGMIRQILKYTVEKGLLYNAYATNLSPLNETEVDCFIGGMVAAGIAPQLTGSSTPAVASRVRYWLDILRQHGVANESSIHILRFPDTFLVQLNNEGSQHNGNSSSMSFGVIWAPTVNYTLLFPPIIPSNSTLLVFNTYTPIDARVVSSFEVSQPLNTLSIFAASQAVVNVSGGCFGRGKRVHEHFTDREGKTSVVILGSISWRLYKLETGEKLLWSVLDVIK